MHTTNDMNTIINLVAQKLEVQISEVQIIEGLL